MLAERGAVAHCGLPTEARTKFEYIARIECMAPFLCGDKLNNFKDCNESSNGVEGACSVEGKALMRCLGSSVSRFYFSNP